MRQIPICDLGARVDPAWNTCVQLIEPHDDLLKITPQTIDNLYLDLETTSQDPEKKSVNPHKHCKILGISVLFDSEKMPYYIPVRHCVLNEDDDYEYVPWNHDVSRVYLWLRQVFSTARNWVNHNIKYDWHVVVNELKYRPPCKLIDTLILSKLAAFEERFTYNLTEMMRVIGVDISPYEEKLKESLGRNNKDYGLIPIDRMAPYAAVDTLAGRMLYFTLLQNIDKRCTRIVNTELDLLPVLCEIEQRGIRFNPIPALSDWITINRKQEKRIQRIKRVTGYEAFQPDKKKSLNELFIDRLGWDLDPTEKTQERIDKGEYIAEKDMKYSFGYASIYKHAKENPRLVSSWINYQEDEKLLTSFTKPYLLEHADNNHIIRPSFNQIVRTGRMSCGNPNMQQLSPRAKIYVVPYSEDHVLVEFDLSQIEFRVIVHYINNRKCINDYNENPDTDFHDWVAGMCNIPRKPAKNINFMLGYGGGRGKCVSMLSELPAIAGTLGSRTLIELKANDVYETYHKVLPELKSTQRRASAVLLDRGFVKTLLGRHRHLPRKVHFKAFNSVCQGSAADIQKDITLRLRKFFSEDCILHALVHDSWLFSIRRSIVEELVPLIKMEIERPIEGVDFSVPIRSSVGISDSHWGNC